MVVVGRAGVVWWCGGVEVVVGRVAASAFHGFLLSLSSPLIARLLLLPFPSLSFQSFQPSLPPSPLFLSPSLQTACGQVPSVVTVRGWVG